MLPSAESITTVIIGARKQMVPTFFTHEAKSKAEIFLYEMSEAENKAEIFSHVMLALLFLWIDFNLFRHSLDC
jgi:hypothetical protein